MTIKPLIVGSNQLNFVDTMDDALIPENLHAFCKDISIRHQVPIEYPYISLMVVISVAIGNNFVVFPLQKGPWTVSFTLWGLLVGESGIGKSPVLNVTSKPLTDLDQEDFRKNALDMKELNSKIKLLESNILTLRKAKKIGEMKKIEAEIAELRKEAKNAKRRIAKDITIEKLKQLMSQSVNRGMLMLYDEISSFLSTLLSSKDHSIDKSFLLSAWNGNVPEFVDRISRDTDIIEKTYLSILGCITPDDFRKKIAAHFERNSADGFMARWQLVMFPIYQKNFMFIDKEENVFAKKMVYKIIQDLDKFNPNSDTQNLYRKDGSGLCGLEFCDDAYSIFKYWIENFRRQIESNGLPPLLSQHFSKYPDLVCKLAGIDHCTNIQDGSISPKISVLSMIRAIAMTEHLEKHAEVMYSLQPTGDFSENKMAVNLLEKMAKYPESLNGVTISWIVKKSWSGLTSNSLVESCLEVLKDHGFIESIRSENSAGGRPTTKHKIPLESMALIKNKSYVEYVDVDQSSRKTPWLDLLKHIIDGKFSEEDVAKNVEFYLNYKEEEVEEEEEEAELDEFTSYDDEYDFIRRVELPEGQLYPKL